MVKYSIIIPIYNEAKNIRLLCFSLKEVIDNLKESYEIIFVNDGSKDDILEEINCIDLRGLNLILVNLKKHYGQSLAMQAGFDISKGELIITMDGDLQNDPKDIPRLLEKMNEGFDVVCGWRHNRKDPLNKLLISKIAYFLHKVIFREEIHDFGCTFRIFKRIILNEIFLFPSAHRFFSLIARKLGFKIGEIKVEHHPRRFGDSKYNMYNRLFEFIRDLMKFLLCDIHKLMVRNNDYRIKEIIRSPV